MYKLNKIFALMGIFMMLAMLVPAASPVSGLNIMSNFSGTIESTASAWTGLKNGPADIEVNYKLTYEFDVDYSDIGLYVRFYAAQHSSAPLYEDYLALGAYDNDSGQIVAPSTTVKYDVPASLATFEIDLDGKSMGGIPIIGQNEQTRAEDQGVDFNTVMYLSADFYNRTLYGDITALGSAVPLCTQQIITLHMPSALKGDLFTFSNIIVDLIIVGVFLLVGTWFYKMWDAKRKAVFLDSPTW